MPWLQAGAAEVEAAEAAEAVVAVAAVAAVAAEQAVVKAAATAGAPARAEVVVAALAEAWAAALIGVPLPIRPASRCEPAAAYRERAVLPAMRRDAGSRRTGV